ncbi:pyruvate dehydrogenase complex dihydrolipoyllysine-residue acetyltransferase [Agaribacter marinus]|uniref:Acetyltransferase component of pyruvate dehydrogenase complex n=1 Tax=Agaribacter marinus TaxID=1431249 RepID=A0AA37WII1_9ALTE|nr:pyruvate dehydrogenase complex dihydrolipoyllysine-residue acetyltransferase [Agaribacter marinus]GLR71042.1 acetyltransferase component of pyruvate dehydrogenase complex [Agaribacter marinus]
MANLVDILVPDVGGDEVEIIEICVAIGDEVEAEASIVTVESDKASMDIPIPFDGVIKEISVAVGDKIKEGDVLGKAEEAAEASDAPVAEAAPTAAPAPVEPAAPVETATPVSGGSTTVEVTVPDIGDAEGVEIIELLVSVGDTVEEEDGLITLETDKATMDVPAPQAGKVIELKVAVGDKVSQGSLVLILETSGGASDAPAVAQAPESVPAPVATATESKIIDVTVPDIGDASDVEIIDVLVSVGDSVEEEDGLITLETDKATMDVPAPQAGKIIDLKVSVGDKVSEGSLVLTLEVAGAVPAASAAASTVPSTPSAPVAAPSAPAPAKSTPAPTRATKSSGKVYASPSVRRVAREFGVDLSLVAGSGRKGRIIKEDVQAYVKAELAKPRGSAAPAASGGGLQVLAQPKVDFSKFGEIEEKPLTRIQKLSGPNLHRNWVTIPHVTQFEEADITELEAFRKQQNVIAEKRKLGVKITPLVFMMKAVADALKAYPTFNTSLSADGEALIQKKYYHIGIAVDTPGGLVVPVVRDVDQKGIIELSKELMDISVKARDGKLKSQDMQGSCFTISSLGGIGGTAFTPIVNAPDVAILGVSKSEMKPKWDGKEFQPRLMLPLSLSYDHRVIDGALACKFAVHLSDALSDIRRILL